MTTKKDMGKIQDEICDLFDDDATFGDVAIRCILGTLMEKSITPGSPDEDIKEDLLAEIAWNVASLTKYLTDRVDDMMDVVKEHLE